jgi:class 3 adenylate cyclase
MASRGEIPWDIGDWLRGLGLGQYEVGFRQNEVTESVLPKLTQEDLKEIGVGPVGHRRIVLDAIAALRARADAKGPPPETPSAPPNLAQDAAERRQVTVMFSDLVGSTALSARMDPEDLREVISAYQKRVAETVQRFGGFVAKYMGDGVPGNALRRPYHWRPSTIGMIETAEGKMAFAMELQITLRTVNDWRPGGVGLHSFNVLPDQ